jgi:8-oxo-dGTP pyrophosphatase MutT (NUDIX family)
MKKVTLLFLRKDDQILLALKKRGFGAGLWNGVGGKVEDETIAQAVVRECREEIGVTPKSVKAAGYLQFFAPDDPTFEHRCYVFTSEHWEGEPIETEEMRPQWFTAAEIPYGQMWPDDTIWMPHLLAGELFSGTVTTSEKEVVSHNIKVVPQLQEDQA